MLDYSYFKVCGRRSHLHLVEYPYSYQHLGLWPQVDNYNTLLGLAITYSQVFVLKVLLKMPLKFKV